jgi:hypothetical protein
VVAPASCAVGDDDRATRRETASAGDGNHCHGKFGNNRWEHDLSRPC